MLLRLKDQKKKKKKKKYIYIFALLCLTLNACIIYPRNIRGKTGCLFTVCSLSMAEWEADFFRLLE